MTGEKRQDNRKIGSERGWTSDLSHAPATCLSAPFADLREVEPILFRQGTTPRNPCS
jgi:hypothetical protein